MKSSSSLTLRLEKSGFASPRSTTPLTGSDSGSLRPGIRSAIRPPGPTPSARAASALTAAACGPNDPLATRIEG